MSKSPGPAPPESTTSGLGQGVERAGSRVLRGGIWQTASQLAPYVMTTIVSIVAARVLGPSGMGRQSYISFIVLTTMTVCSAGFPGTIPRYVGELIGREREGVIPALAAWSWRVELVAGAIGAGFLVGVAAFGGTPHAAWLFGAVAAFTGILHKVPGSFLNGAQRWRQNSIVVLGTGVVATVATVIVLLLGGGITGIFVVLAAANVAMLLWASALHHRLLARITAAREPLGRLRREIAHFAIAASVPMILNFLVFQRSEFFFLNHYSTDAQIALYSIAFSAYAALVALPAALGNTFAPAVATLAGAGAHARIRAGYARGLRLLLFISIPLTAGALVFGPPLLELVYGAEYEGARPLFLVLLAPLPFVPLGGLSGGLLFGYGRIRVPVILGIVAGVVDVVLAALLVPGLDAMGAALANISAQLVGAILAVVYCVRLVGGVQLAPRHLTRVIVASAVAAGAAQLVLILGGGAGPFLLALLVGVTVFSVLIVSLRVLPREDADWLAAAADGRRSGRITRLCQRLSGAPLGAH